MIANTLVDYNALCEKDPDDAVDAMKERVKELINKESQYEIQATKNETLTEKVTVMNKVMELQMNG